MEVVWALFIQYIRVFFTFDLKFNLLSPNRFRSADDLNDHFSGVMAHMKEYNKVKKEGVEPHPIVASLEGSLSEMWMVFQDT